MGKPPLPTDTLDTAQALRQRMTDAEKLLWKRLRNRQFENLKFRRQHPVPPYIVDFYCEDLNLIIELDGGQHTQDADQNRTEFLERQGYRVLRFWNNDVLENIDGILMKLKEQL